MRKAGQKAVLSDRTYQNIADKYLIKLIMKSNWTVELVEKFIWRDYFISPKNEKYFTRCMDKIKKEYSEHNFNEVNKQLNRVFKILKKSPKIGMNKNNELVRLYPKPVIKDKKIAGIKYTDNKNYMLPDYLYDHWMYRDSLKNFRNLEKEEQTDIIKSLISEGYNMADISKKINYSDGSTRKLIRDNGLDVEGMDTEEHTDDTELTPDEMALYNDLQLELEQEQKEFKGLPDEDEKTEPKRVHIDLQELSRLRVDEGYSVKSLAQYYNCSVGTVNSRLSELPEDKRKARKSKDKIEVYKIVGDLSNGMSYKEISKKYGLSVGHISELVKFYTGNAQI